jgi:AcrR family transcriptional regulator
MADEPASSTEGDDGDLRAADGRVPGRRGRATRQRLLESTSELLEHQTYRDLKVVDIARQAGTSPATFYQYFPDVTTAILALAEDMADEGSAVLTRLVTDGPWDGSAGYDTAVAISTGFLKFWDAHWPLMRVMELTSAEGDERFRSIRIALLNEFTTALADVVARFQAEGKAPAGSPMATAGALVSMLAHVAAHRYGFENFEIRTKALQASMANILFVSVTGQQPPA